MHHLLPPSPYFIAHACAVTSPLEIVRSRPFAKNAPLISLPWTRDIFVCAPSSQSFHASSGRERKEEAACSHFVFFIPVSPDRLRRLNKEYTVVVGHENLNLPSLACRIHHTRCIVTWTICCVSCALVDYEVHDSSSANDVFEGRTTLPLRKTGSSETAVRQPRQESHVQTPAHRQHRWRDFQASRWRPGGGFFRKVRADRAGRIATSGCFRGYATSSVKWLSLPSEVSCALQPQYWLCAHMC